MRPAHRVLDPGAFEADIETVAGLAVKLRAQLFAQERGDVIRLHSMNGGPGQTAIDRRQLSLPFEYHVGSVLALIHTPVVLRSKIAVDRTIGARKLIQLAVQ